MYSSPFGYPASRGAPHRPSAPQTFYAGTEANFSNQWWYPDSGASHHVTPEASNLTDFVSLSGTEQVFMGNGQGLSINSVGSMFFPLPNNSTLSITLNNLLLVPHITKNLMSVSKFAQDNNVFFEFHPKFCVVKSQASSEVLLCGSVGSDGLYKFPNPATQLSKLSSSSNSSSAQSISKTKCSASCNVSCSSVAPTNHVSNCLSNCIPQCITPCNFDQYNNNTMSSFSNSPSLNSTTYNTELTSSHSNSSSSIANDKYVLWHTRLGHPNHHALVEVFKLCNLPILPKPSTELCHACCLGKSHRLPSTL